MDECVRGERRSNAAAREHPDEGFAILAKVVSDQYEHGDRREGAAGEDRSAQAALDLLAGAFDAPDASEYRQFREGAYVLQRVERVVELFADEDDGRGEQH